MINWGGCKERCTACFKEMLQYLPGGLSKSTKSSITKPEIRKTISPWRLIFEKNGSHQLWPIESVPPNSVDKACDCGVSWSRSDTETHRAQKGADCKSTAPSATMMSNDGLSPLHLSRFGYAMET